MASSFTTMPAPGALTSSAPLATSTMDGDRGQTTIDYSVCHNHCNIYIFAVPISAAFLVGISCWVVVRSMMFRRSVRRQLEDAMLAGALLPEHVEAFSKGQTVWKPEQPKMWEVCVPKESKASLDLEGVLPVSANIIPHKDAPQFTELADRNKSIIRRIQSPFPRTPPRSPSHLEQGFPYQVPLSNPDQLQMTVFISLPSPQKQSDKTEKWQGLDEEEHLNDVVFGVTEFPWNAEAWRFEKEQFE